MFDNIFVGLGWPVGDGGERHHDEVWIGFGPSCRWMKHDIVVSVCDCTADNLLCFLLCHLATYFWTVLQYKFVL